ncbi:hypothetical protein R3P38DRAFT_2804896 [Favolaschia claudopus]|uniref:Vacuolar protein sorting-associated protein 13 second N-terminal domain-containing protein n=1 Tax=Favolaschia claudopus TaxID=2862362 RepID=A0AAV9ZPY2_9AGAR
MTDTSTSHVPLDVPMTDTTSAARLEIQGTDDQSFGDLYRSVSQTNAKAHGAENRLDKLGADALEIKDRLSGFENSTLFQGATALKNADPGHLISESVAAVSKFAENSARIMKGLDVVKQIHPYIGIVALAFQTAIQLELGRRERDKKVISLKTEMMKMMEILLDLKGIKDPKRLDPNGTTLEGRMQSIVVRAEQDIRDCSASCEKYMEKKFIVKLFDTRWDGRLAAFSDLFAERSKEFSIALSLHTAQGVDTIQETLVGLQITAKNNNNSSAMLLLFKRLESPEVGELQNWIKEKGGPEIVAGNEKLFKELQSKMKDMKEAMPKSGETQTTEMLIFSVRQAMRESIDISLARDRKHFDQTFNGMQVKLDEMKKFVGHSTDRGPHDRIRDTDIHDVWKEMHWRGSVKARHFIVAVQDHFLHKYSREDERLDAVNRATTAEDPPARPVEGELEDRWAVRFAILCARYAKAIENVRSCMVAVSAEVLPCNRARVDKYMSNGSLTTVDIIVRTVLAKWDNYYDDDQALMSNFTDYITAEQTRLITNLDRFEWELDDNTLPLIAGTGRIERLACNRPLDDRELLDAEFSVDAIEYAVRRRVDALESNFRTQNLDPATEFELAYKGMFKTIYLYYQDDNSVYNWEYPESYLDSEDRPDEGILKYESPEIGVPKHIYSDTTHDDEASTDKFNGLWVGTYTYPDRDEQKDGILSAHLYILDEEQTLFAGSGTDSVGRFEITGEIRLSETPAEKFISFRKQYEQFPGQGGPIWSYRGSVSVKESGRMTAMVGEWGPWVEGSSESGFEPYGTFQMDRTPAIVARHRPSVAEFEQNAAQARWKLVLGVVLEEVRRKVLNTNHFRDRRRDRTTFVEATLRIESAMDPLRYGRQWDGSGNTYDGDLETLNELKCRLSPEDIQFYTYLANLRLEQECFHPCLDCIVPDNAESEVDLCENCKENPSLRVIYMRRRIVIERLGQTQKQRAQEIITRAETYPKHSREKQKGETPTEDSKELEEDAVIRCLYCRKKLSRPCWFCVECGDDMDIITYKNTDIFVCGECEKGQLDMSKRTSKSQSGEPGPMHKAGLSCVILIGWYHVLVEVKDVVPEPPHIEVDMRLANLEKRFAAHETAMQHKLDSLKELLSKLLERLG